MTDSSYKRQNLGDGQQITHEYTCLSLDQTGATEDLYSGTYQMTADSLKRLLLRREGTFLGNIGPGQTAVIRWSLKT